MTTELEQLLLTVVQPGLQGLELWRVRGTWGRWNYDRLKPCIEVPDLTQWDSADEPEAQKAVSVWLHEAGHSHQAWTSTRREEYNRNPIPLEVDAWQRALGFARKLGLKWTPAMHEKLVDGLTGYLELNQQASNHVLVQQVVGQSLVEASAS